MTDKKLPPGGRGVWPRSAEEFTDETGIKWTSVWKCEEESGEISDPGNPGGFIASVKFMPSKPLPVCSKCGATKSREGWWQVLIFMDKNSGMIEQTFSCLDCWEKEYVVED